MPVARCESAGSMRKAGGLAGVGEGEREGTPYQQNSTPYQQNSTPYQQNSTPYQQNSTPYQQNSTPYQQNSIDKRFKTVFCRSFPQNSI